MKYIKEKGAELIFLISALASIFAVAMICIFLFANGLPAMGEIGVFDFLLGKKWKPGNDIYGILILQHFRKKNSPNNGVKADML